MWEGKESSRQDRALTMRGSQSPRDEAGDADKGLGPGMVQRRCWGLWNTGEYMGSIDRPTEWEQVAAWDLLGVREEEMGSVPTD